MKRGIGPNRRPVYGMAYGVMSGVQSSPRIMRGAPVVTPGLFDVPLTNRRRDVAIVHEQGRLTTVNSKKIKTGERVVEMPDVLPMSGLESQGLARTLGSLGGCTLAGNTLGDDAADRAEMAMAKECMRPGEVLMSPGRCGPDPRSRVNPYAAAPTTSAIPISVTRALGAMDPSTSKALLLGGVAIAAYFLLRKK